MNKNYDFVVSGAGLIGTITALQLSQKGYSCCLIEKTSLSKKSSYDNFSPLSLNYRSFLILNNYGLWDEISTYAHPIEEINLKSFNSLNRLSFTSKDLGLKVLGFVVDRRLLLSTFHRALAKSPNINFIHFPHYIDNTLFLSYGDNSSTIISSGFPGIHMMSGTCYVDNFSVIKYTSTGASATLWTPTSIAAANLAGWWKADSGTTIDADNRVATWNDNSANANNFTQGTDAHKPILVSNLINGLSVLHFQDSSDVLSAVDSASLDITTGVSVFIVINPFSQTSPTSQDLLNKGTLSEFIESSLLRFKSSIKLSTPFISASVLISIFKAVCILPILPNIR